MSGEWMLPTVAEERAISACHTADMLSAISIACTLDGADEVMFGRVAEYDEDDERTVLDQAP